MLDGRVEWVCPNSNTSQEEELDFEHITLVSVLVRF